MKLTVFTMLVALTLLLAAQVGETASSVMAQSDPNPTAEIHVCYSACAFTR
ncbi:MAG: hypothetical protein ACOCX3_02145 [Chloroflexota bacterium]